MPTDDPVSMEVLDELYESLVVELERLVTLGEGVIVEMEAVDDERLALRQNGTQLLRAREARREALVVQTRAIECVDHAVMASSRARDLATQLEATIARSRVLIDGPDAR